MNNQLNERLFWMRRSTKGSAELGYLLTLSQLQDEFLNSQPNFNIENYLNGNTFKEFAGNYWHNDTFTIHEIKDLDEVKDLLTWKGFNPEDLPTSIPLDTESYPDFVPQELRCEKYVAEFSGKTSFCLPRDFSPNPTIMDYCRICNLDPDDLSYHPTELDYIKQAIAEMIKYPELFQKGVTPEFVEKLLECHHLSLADFEKNKEEMTLE